MTARCCSNKTSHRIKEKPMLRHSIAALTAAAMLSLSCFAPTHALARGSFNHIGNVSGAIGFVAQSSPTPRRSSPQRPPSHRLGRGGIHGELPLSETYPKVS
jgi:hypothetical protein